MFAGYPLVVRLEITFKYLRWFRCYGNIDVCIHCRGVAARCEMLAGACRSANLFVTDRVSEAGNAVDSVCLYVRPFVSTLTLESSGL